jgi:hypothetical protein
MKELKPRGIRIDTWLCVMLGSSMAQIGWLLAGLAVTLHVFSDVDWSGFHTHRDGDVAIPALLAIATIAYGTHKSRLLVHAVKYGVLTTAIVKTIERDPVSDSPEFTVGFECVDAGGHTQTLCTNRQEKDVIVGERLNIISDEQNGTRFLEQDLPGGMTFEHVISLQRVPYRCFVRVLVIPALSALPLLGYLPEIRAFLQFLTTWLGYPVPYQMPMIAQAVWLLSNWKQFTVSELKGASACGPKPLPCE